MQEEYSSNVGVDFGTGVLTWGRGERVSDRYGFVWLMPEGCDSHTTNPGGNLLNAELVKSTIPGFPEGVLVAEVIETRHSTHIGDLLRGIFPTTPEVGDVYLLGTGTLALTSTGIGEETVGLVPADGRESDWLDPHALYRVHEQTVRLRYFPTPVALPVPGEHGLLLNLRKTEVAA